MNTLRVGFLLTVLTLAFVSIGGWLGGTSGMTLAFVLAAAINVGSYWFSDRIVLRTTGAQPLRKETAPTLHAMTLRLADRAGIPMPSLYVVPDRQPNAFATGRNPENGVVAVTQGLLDTLSTDQVEGVIAHEIAHIKHRDTLTMTVAATLAGAIMTLINVAQWSTLFRGDGDGPGFGSLLLAGLVAPLAAGMIQMAISRSREYEADRTAANLAGSAQGLMGALRSLSRASQIVPSSRMRESTAHLAIVNPLAGNGATFARLFATHPPLSERIAALQEVESTLQRHDRGFASMTR